MVLGQRELGDMVVLVAVIVRVTVIVEETVIDSRARV